MKPIPEHLRTKDYNRVIGEFQENCLLTFVPSRHSGPKNMLVKSDYDLFILSTAKQLNAVVLSRDHYRKEKLQHPEYDELISYRTRLLQPTIVRDLCILPDDPLGPGGPNLKTCKACCPLSNLTKCLASGHARFASVKRMEKDVS